jgi:hypothetical protein
MGYIVIHLPCYIVLPMVMSSFIDPATLYCAWLCRHSLYSCLSIMLGCLSCPFRSYLFLLQAVPLR